MAPESRNPHTPSISATIVSGETSGAGAFLVFDEADSLLAALTALTPGDFAVVHRKAEILGGMKEPAALLAMLRAECEAKPDRPRAIGFLR